MEMEKEKIKIKEFGNWKKTECELTG